MQPGAQAGFGGRLVAEVWRPHPPRWHSRDQDHASLLQGNCWHARYCAMAPCWEVGLKLGKRLTACPPVVFISSPRSASQIARDSVMPRLKARSMAPRSAMWPRFPTPWPRSQAATGQPGQQGAAVPSWALDTAGLDKASPNSCHSLATI